MCQICVDYQRQRMTLQEAKRAFREMVVEMEPEHAREVRQLLKKGEDEAKKDD